jgi:colicin import membrane protein
MSLAAAAAGPLTLRALPALATVALHGLLLLALLARWESDASRAVEARELSPQIIDAKLVTMDRYQPPKAKPRPRPEPARKAAPSPKARQQPAAAAREPAPAPAPKAAPPAETAPAPEPAREPAPEPERLSADELAALTRQELAEAVADEDQARVAVSAEEMAASYAALIQRTVVGYWSRPPSARNGMEALLAVQLVPTGEVVSVSVLRSSGNAAFDRSAINAVERAGSFPELANLPGDEFERTFRRFRLLFRPEDLRY